MDDTTSYDVRFYKTVVYKGSRVTTYYVRWKVSSQEWMSGDRYLGPVHPF